MPFNLPEYGATFQMAGHPGYDGAQEVSDASGRPYPVDANDVMRAVVQTPYLDGTFSLYLEDHTKGWHWSRDLSGSPDKSAWDTAEWIVEAPLPAAQGRLPLTQFSPVTFQDCFALGPRGTVAAVAEFPAISRLDLSVPDGDNENTASPSDLVANPGHGPCFTVKWGLATSAGAPTAPGSSTSPDVLRLVAAAVRRDLTSIVATLRRAHMRTLARKGRFAVTAHAAEQGAWDIALRLPKPATSGVAHRRVVFTTAGSRTVTVSLSKRARRLFARVRRRTRVTVTIGFLPSKPPTYPTSITHVVTMRP
jgi:hypothetical protein